MNRCLTLVLAFVGTAAVSASAQSAPDGTRYFVEAGAAADRDANTLAGRPTTVPAFTTAFGAAFSNLWTIRFDASLPGWHESSYTDVFGPGSSGVTTTVTTRQRHRLIGLGFLAGRDLPAGARLRVTPLAGFSSFIHTDRGDSVVLSRTATRVFHTDSYGYTQHEPRIALSAGADLSFQTSERVALVPQIRIVGVLGDDWEPIVRTGVAVRIGL